jgi:purine-binding chemotaxis protein CheW
MSAIEDIAPAARAARIPLLDAGRAAVTATPHECLTFRLGGEEYGIDILRVQEIRGYEHPTRIANAPSFVKGVLNLRGVIVPIVDLRLKFGLEHAAYDGVTVTVVLNVAGRTLGAVVDSVSDVIELKGDQIKPAPEFNTSVDAGYITGIGAFKQGDLDRMLILVDIEELMSSPEMGLIGTDLH